MKYKIVTKPSKKGIIGIIIALAILYVLSYPALNFYFDHQKVYMVDESTQNISWGNVIVIHGFLKEVKENGDFIIQDFNKNVSLYVHKTEKLQCIPHLKNSGSLFNYIKIAGAYNFVESKFSQYDRLMISAQYVQIGKEKFLATKTYGFFGVWIVNGC